MKKKIIVAVMTVVFLLLSVPLHSLAEYSGYGPPKPEPENTFDESVKDITVSKFEKEYGDFLYDYNGDGKVNKKDYVNDEGYIKKGYYLYVKAKKEEKEFSEEKEGKEAITTAIKRNESISSYVFSAILHANTKAVGVNATVKNTNIPVSLKDTFVDYIYNYCEVNNVATVEESGYMVYDSNEYDDLLDMFMTLARYAVKNGKKVKITDDDAIKTIVCAGIEEYLDSGDEDEAKSAIRLAITTQAITAGSGNEKLEKIKEGGFDYYSADVNQQVNTLYEYMFPIGVAIMLVAWALGILKTGMTNSFSLADKYSVVNALLRLMIGVVVMCSLGEMLSLGMSASQTMCNSLYNKLCAGVSTSVNFNFFSKFIRYTLMLNMVALAVLQGFAPLFAGFCVLEQKKPAMNFLREYCKCLLVPPITIVYTVMATKMLDGFDSTGLSYIAKVVGALVLSIACINSAKKIVQGLIQ